MTSLLRLLNISESTVATALLAVQQFETLGYVEYDSQTSFKGHDACEHGLVFAACGTIGLPPYGSPREAGAAAEISARVLNVLVGEVIDVDKLLMIEGADWLTFKTYEYAVDNPHILGEFTRLRDLIDGYGDGELHQYIEDRLDDPIPYSQKLKDWLDNL